MCDDTNTFDDTSAFDNTNTFDDHFCYGDTQAAVELMRGGALGSREWFPWQQLAIASHLSRLRESECRERRVGAEDSRIRHLQDNMRNLSLLSNVSLSGEEEKEKEVMAMN